MQMLSRSANLVAVADDPVVASTNAGASAASLTTNPTEDCADLSPGWGRYRGWLAGLAMAPLLAAALAPGAAFADTLDQALAKAYNNNPTLLAERARLRAIDEAVPQALSNWRPTVTLTGEAGVARTDSATATPHVRTTEPTTAEITVTQPLYRGGRTTAEIARAENEVRAARARLS
ncbi:MAG: hypothetical protein E2O65_14850, partial [Gammaproteobacteria bacterium]